MHDSTTVLDGIDKLIAQLHLHVPAMIAGGDNVGGETLIRDEMFSLVEMREELERYAVRQCTRGMLMGSTVYLHPMILVQPSSSTSWLFLFPQLVVC